MIDEYLAQIKEQALRMATDCTSASSQEYCDADIKWPVLKGTSRESSQFGPIPMCLKLDQKVLELDT